MNIYIYIYREREREREIITKWIIITSFYNSFLTKWMIIII